MAIPIVTAEPQFPKSSVRPLLGQPVELETNA
jgi:hypothetical protein